MIRAQFFSSGATVFGFRLSGHSGFSPIGSDIVCASVSSCAYMVANTVTDVYNIAADVKQGDGFLSLTVPLEEAPALQPLFSGFKLHLNALAKDYRKFLKVQNVSIHN